MCFQTPATSIRERNNSHPEQVPNSDIILDFFENLFSESNNTVREYKVINELPGQRRSFSDLISVGRMILSKESDFVQRDGTDFFLLKTLIPKHSPRNKLKYLEKKP